VVAKVREKLTVNKQSHTDFNLGKLNEVEGKEKHCVYVSNRFPAWKDLTLRSILIALEKRVEKI
jgi:hypothetical protein